MSVSFKNQSIFLKAVFKIALTFALFLGGIDSFLFANLEESKKKCEGLEAEINEMAQTLQAQEARLVQLKEYRIRHEQEIFQHQLKINNLKAQKQKLRLKRHQMKNNSQAYMTLAMRLSRTPPELFLGMRHSNHEMILGLHYLKSTLAHLKNKSIKYQQTKKSIADQKVEFKKIDLLLAEESEKLRQEELDIENLKAINEKARLEKESLLVVAQKKLQTKVCGLNSVKELLRAIPQEKPVVSALGKSSENVDLDTEKGRFLIPVSGKIRTYFQDLDEQGHKSHGIYFEAEPNSDVKAPYDGKVAFCGPFRHYSNIVILDHNQGYHSLLMGLEKVFVVLGQELRKSDLIGHVAGKDAGFFLEFRRHLQPIDPMPWFEK